MFEQTERSGIFSQVQIKELSWNYIVLSNSLYCSSIIMHHDTYKPFYTDPCRKYGWSQLNHREHYMPLLVVMPWASAFSAQYLHLCHWFFLSPTPWRTQHLTGHWTTVVGFNLRAFVHSHLVAWWQEDGTCSIYCWSMVCWDDSDDIRAPIPRKVIDWRCHGAIPGQNMTWWGSCPQGEYTCLVECEMNIKCQHVDSLSTSYCKKDHFYCSV